MKVHTNLANKCSLHNFKYDLIAITEHVSYVVIGKVPKSDSSTICLCRHLGKLTSWSSPLTVTKMQVPSTKCLAASAAWGLVFNPASVGMGFVIANDVVSDTHSNVWNCDSRIFLHTLYIKVKTEREISLPAHFVCYAFLFIESILLIYLERT